MMIISFYSTPKNNESFVLRVIITMILFFLFQILLQATTVHATNTIITNNSNSNSDNTTKCDESKCTSPTKRPPRIDCWASGPNTGEPFDCRDGYIGVAIEDVPLNEDGLQYYTCCPPPRNDDDGGEEEVEVPPPKRQCNSEECTSDNWDCIVNVDEYEAMTCSNNNNNNENENSIYIYARIMGQAVVKGELYAQYTCCETPGPGGTVADDDVVHDDDGSSDDSNNCSVNYCSSPGETKFEPLDCVVTKTNGLLIEPMTCNNKGNSNDNNIYQYPRIVGEFFNDGKAFVSYTCCDTYNGTNLYLEEARFYWIFVPHLIVAIVVFTILSCFIVVIISSKETRKHTFNIYLVLLEVPDLIVNGAMIVWFTYRLINQEYSNANTLSSSLLAALSANMWLNAVVAYEILVLLHKSHRRMHAQPPMKRKALIQATIVYLYSIGLGIINYVFVEIVDIEIMEVLLVPILFVLSMGIPLLYLIYVTFHIWKRKLLPRTGRTRGVTIYFTRIVCAFFTMYLPGGLCIAFDEISIGLYFLSLQGVVSVIVAIVSNKDIRDASSQLPRKGMHFLSLSISAAINRSSSIEFSFRSTSNRFHKNSPSAAATTEQISGSPNNEGIMASDILGHPIGFCSNGRQASISVTSTSTSHHHCDLSERTTTNDVAVGGPAGGNNTRVCCDDGIATKSPTSVVADGEMPSVVVPEAMMEIVNEDYNNEGSSASSESSSPTTENNTLASCGDNEELMFTPPSSQFQNEEEEDDDDIEEASKHEVAAVGHTESQSPDDNNNEDGDDDYDDDSKEKVIQPRSETSFLSSIDVWIEQSEN